MYAGLIYSACQLNKNTGALGSNVRFARVDSLAGVEFKSRREDYPGNYITCYTLASKSIDYVYVHRHMIGKAIRRKMSRDENQVMNFLILASMHATVKDLMEVRDSTLNQYVEDLHYTQNAQVLHKNMYHRALKELQK